MKIKRKEKIYEVISETESCYEINMGSIVGNMLVDKESCDVMKSYKEQAEELMKGCPYATGMTFKETGEEIICGQSILEGKLFFCRRCKSRMKILLSAGEYFEEEVEIPMEIWKQVNNSMNKLREAIK